jgi:hypothetical protein
MTDYDDVSDTIHLQGLGSALPTFAKGGFLGFPEGSNLLLTMYGIPVE